MKDKQMIVYKESFFSKFIKKIKSIFKKDKIVLVEKQEQTVTNSDTKQEIMELYNNIKAKKINLEEVDENKLYKVMLLMNEELQMLCEKMNKQMEKVDINLYNLNMYKKEIEILKKNA